jgi:cell division protein FtsW
LIIIFLTAFGMMTMAGARMVHLGAVVLVALLLFGSLVVARPYVRDRITTFIDPTSNPLTSSYQIQQSLIAIGSGGWLGRGFGQSVQKFDYLPEAVGDSIFAVVAEEFGFVGSTALIALFIGFAWRGFRISARSPNNFTRLLSGGFVILIISESFINISSMLGVIPLTGTPLLFVSHGGSAMLFALAESGVIYGISRYSLISKS